MTDSVLVALSTREKAFVAAYEGNATEAAKKAGYAGDRPTLATTGYRLMRRPEVRAAIEKRDTALAERFALNIIEGQELLTRIALDDDEPTETRLAALRDLMKSQGAFVHRHEVAIGKSLEEFLKEALTGEPKE